MLIYDFCVVGGGIVGLATAMKLLEARPGASLLLLEKEDGVAKHQSSHNSGVIHAGIYYEPGSLKAKLCKAGLRATIEFCTDHQLAFKQCGKLIVATNELEEVRINALFSRASANGIGLERLSAGDLRRLEPNITGVAALLSRETGMVDYPSICRAMAEVVAGAGGQIRLKTTVDHIHEEGEQVTIGAATERWAARKLVVCGGLQSDRLARLAGLDVDFQVVPFRGEYFRLPGDKGGIISHHIYPAPDPELPFLGVHLTRMIDGSVTVGPNAVIGLAREGYRKASINFRDLWQFATFGGFWRLVAKNHSHAAHELYGSMWKRAYLDECRKYCPSLQLIDLLPYRAGIRAQLVTAAGNAVSDFLFKETDRMLHVCNAPSPAATSAIPIGGMIAHRCLGISF